MQQNFVHLRIRTEFSLVDSIIRIKPMVKQLAEMGVPACAVTDFHNFFGLIKFYKAAEGSGVKPILGCDLQYFPEGEDEKPCLVSLLAINEQGYKNIIEIISESYQQGQIQGVPYVNYEWLKKYSEGVIALSGGKFGDVGQKLLSNKIDEAESLLSFWLETFPGRFYLELQRTNRSGDENYLHRALALAEKFDCPVVATNDVRFLQTSQYEVHEARVCIGESRTLDDPRRERRYSDQQYLKTPQEMCELFSDIPQAIENTLEIAKRCNVDIQLGKYFLPEYPIPEGMTENEFFVKVCEDGLENRLSKILNPEQSDYQEKRKAYFERLKFELDIIIQMGFPGYFLIVMDFIQWAKDQKIPVGPGRGSGAGSLVAYSLDITDLDPLQYDLLFERFLNPERVSMPDFDVDFCMEDRDKVIGYVADNYGRNAVSQIITFGTMAAKAVVRDVARVLGKSYGLADKLSKMIPPDVGMTLSKAFEQEEVLREFIENDSDAPDTPGVW